MTRCRCIGTEVMCYNNKNCQHGGRCYEDFPQHSYKCSCTPGYTGKHCEYGELVCHFASSSSGYLRVRKFPAENFRKFILFFPEISVN